MSEALLEQAPAIRATPQAENSEVALGPRWLPPLVLLASIAVGISVYAYFWQHSRDLWWWMGHDRHTHYMYGLDLAFDIRTGNLVRLMHDFDRMRVWGPIHPVLVAALQIVAGPDHRLAVVPSLLGWILTIWCAFLIPRRVLPSGGNAAGLLAALLVAVSPAHRAFATDCMYESLGAGLSLASIYLYLVVVQDGSRRAAVLFALTLSALFLHKYNYWLLVLFGLVGGEFVRQPRAWLQYALGLIQRERLPSWALAELKHPLNYIALACAIGAVIVVITGGGVITLGSARISMQEPHNFVHVAYIAFFIRLVLWWRHRGRAWSLTIAPTVRELIRWHGGIIALWFLMPKRLSYFIWFLGPTNDDQKRESVPFMHGLPYYLQGLVDDYLTVTLGLYLLGGAVILGLLAWRKLQPGVSALMIFLLIATYLTCQHPMLKYRFMHSWIAAAWIVGVIGLVYSVQAIAGLISREWRPWTAGIVCAIAMCMIAPGLLEPGHAQEGGLKPDLPSPLRITDTYLPALADTRRPTIVSNVSTRFLWRWTFIEHHRHHNMDAEIKNFKLFENNPDQAKQWLESTRSDALVLIDIQPYTTYDWKTKEYVDLATFHQVLAAQSVWTESRRWHSPEGVTITLWEKKAASSQR